MLGERLIADLESAMTRFISSRRNAEAVSTMTSRNLPLAMMLLGTWWMDLGATRWFNDPRMWAENEK